MKKNNLSSMDRFRIGADMFGKVPLLTVGLLAGAAAVQASTDYAPAIWRSAYSGHWYTSGYGHRFMVEHDIEGYYASCISYLQRSTTSVSITYTVNGKKDATSDYPAGEVTQMVREAYYAWHVRCWNKYMHGTEHEGFVSNPAWFTEALYVASAGVTEHVCNKYGLPKDRNHVIGHNEHKNSHWEAWMNGQGYSDTFVNCNTHSDPGAYWNWTHYMDLVTGTASTPSAPSGLNATTVSASQINLVWVDNSGIESGFKVERSTASGSGFAQIGTTAANIKTYSSTGLASGTTYYYRVRAWNAAGNSGYSNTDSATTLDTVPAAPSSLTATAVSSSQVNLAWADGSSNEDGFKVERSTDNVTFTQVATTGINVLTYNNTGLAANTLYYYRVRSYNTAGNSAYSNTASDTTAPAAPTGLTATAVSSSQINLAWTDNSANENGFKIERGTASGGPFTSIGTNVAGVVTYSSTGLSASTAYYYRVCSFNANGNSTYSNVASATTLLPAPVLAAIGNKTVNAGSPLTFTASSTDPNHSVVTTTWQTFESFTNNTPNESVMFNKPSNSTTTSAFIDTTAANTTQVTTSFPTGHAAGKVMKASWTFKTGQTNPWCRLNTFNPPNVPNPTVDGGQVVQFDICATKSLKVGIGFRETGTSAAYGANGGTTGNIDWAGVTNVVSGNPIPNRTLTANVWTTIVCNVPFDPQAGFTGDGKVVTAKAVLEEIVLSANGNTGATVVYMDNFAVVAQNTLTFSLDAGFPAGATINAKTGAFAWTPTTGQAGNWNITVRVTDQLGQVDFELIKVTVVGGNTPPILAAIGNKSVNEGTALGFTATATDVDVGQTLTFSLDAGNPSGSSITTGGVFSWTPTEAQGPGAYPITVRVTDNGTPSSNDFEAITVTVNEVNVAPVLAAIANQTVNEGSTLNVTASATDADSPANTITYSLDPGAPAGMTIGSSSGAISWTTGEANGPNTYPVTVRATDNGTPALYNTKSFNVTVNEVDVAPVLTINSTITTITNIADFETFGDGTYNGTVLFHQPSYSSTTSAFLDTTNNLSSVEGTFPAGNLSTRALHALFTFKSTAVNPWVRFTTFNASTVPNPTIDLTQRLRFDIYTDKTLKLGLGIRETATGAAIGANGGTTGSLEYIGVTNVASGAPQPNRVISAGAWTTVEFNLPAEPCKAFTGNGILAGGKGVLEHLILAGNGVLGPFNVYLDNFQVVTVTTNLTVDTLSTITVSNSATDADLPAQSLTYSLDAGAPANAIIDPLTGVFEWTPDGSAAITNVITVRVTDDGPGALSDAKSMTIIVNKLNTAPTLSGVPGDVIETNAGTTISFTLVGEDDDIPVQNLTFSMINPPAGATLNASTGDFSWTPPNTNSTNIITFRVTDDGVPPLYAEEDATILIVPTNTAPTLLLSSTKVYENVVTYETMTDMTNEHVMFNKAGNSSTTSAFIDTAATQTSYVTNNFPAGGTNAHGSKVMKFVFSFKTGTSNPWCRMNTLLVGTPNHIKNPTLELNQTVRMDVYTTKQLRLGLGLRETLTTAAIGADGGSTGNIEWVGVTNVVSGSPQPSRVITASNWTTLTFDCTTDSVRSFTGNGVLASGKGVLEHLALIPDGGMGAYTVYVDNFTQIYTYAAGATATANTGALITSQATGTDIDTPVQALFYGQDADNSTNAVIDQNSGAFSWTPTSADVGSWPTTIIVEDDPTNGAISKSASQTFTVTVNSDPLGPQ